MDWRHETPSDTVGFAIEYRAQRRPLLPLKNRLFPTAGGALGQPAVDAQSPIRSSAGCTSRATPTSSALHVPGAPVFMSADERSVTARRRRWRSSCAAGLSGLLNVAFPRFRPSQAFVDLYESACPISTLLPPNADAGLDFVPTHPERRRHLPG
jgi:hypothetical protein